MARQRENLVLTRAGPSSLHRAWLEGERNFDVLVAAYHPDAVNADADGLYHLYIPGSKVVGWSHVFKSQPELLARYRQIALIDDDIETTAETISRCFDFGADQ